MDMQEVSRDDFYEALQDEPMATAKESSIHMPSIIYYDASGNIFGRISTDEDNPDEFHYFLR